MPDEQTGFARVPIAQLTLAEASELTDDATLWVNTRILILFHFPQVSVAGYWDLTVHDHAEMLTFLQAAGLYG